MQSLEKELKNYFQINQKDDGSATISLTASKEWAFYQGHFPGMPILPGYGITEISVFFAQKIVEKSFRLLAVHALRMRNPIVPGMQLELTLNKQTDECRFQIIWKLATEEKALLATIDFELGGKATE